MSVLPSTVASLYEQAGALLLVAEDALAGTAAGTPARTFVAPAEPPYDCCPFLAVLVPGISEDSTSFGQGGVAAGHRATTGSVILASYAVLAVRCAPEWNGKQPPDENDIEEVAAAVLADGWALWNELKRAIRCKEIFGTCREVYFDGGSSIPEQGGCVGWRFSIRASLDGIPGECES